MQKSAGPRPVSCMSEPACSSTGWHLGDLRAEAKRLGRVQVLGEETGHHVPGAAPGVDLLGGIADADPSIRKALCGGTDRIGAPTDACDVCPKDVLNRSPTSFTRADNS